MYNKNNKKRAFVNIIFLGMLLFVAVIIFLGSNADDEVRNNKYFNLKKLTETTAMGLGKHYIQDHDILAAEEIIENIVLDTNLGVETYPYMEYTWNLDDLEQPHILVAIIDYPHENFWYKFMGKKEFNFSKIESRVDIIGIPVEDAIHEGDGSIIPFAINNCNRPEIKIGDEMSINFDDWESYTDTDLNHFWGVYPFCDNSIDGNSEFSHFKNSVTSETFENFSNDTHTDRVCTVDSDNAEQWTHVQPKQISEAFLEGPFSTLPYNMDILIVDCGSTGREMSVLGVVTVKVDSYTPFEKNKTPLTLNITIEAPPNQEIIKLIY